MGNRSVLSRMSTGLSGKYSALVAALGLCAGALAWPAQAGAQELPHATPDVGIAPPSPLPPPIELPLSGALNQVPGHFRVGDHYFDSGLGGLRTYLETVRSTNPALYGQLAPDLDRLQSKATRAAVFALTGLGVTVASTLAIAATWRSCSDASLSNPTAFAREVAASDACDSSNQHRLEVFGTIGVAALASGLLAAAIVSPRDADLVDFVNKHNALVGSPLKLQMGFDPASQMAFGGATLAF